MTISFFSIVVLTFAELSRFPHIVNKSVLAGTSLMQTTSTQGATSGVF